MHAWEILRELSKIQRTLIMRSEPDLRAQGLSSRLTLLLAAVRRFPHASDISRMLGLPAPTVSRLLKRLEADGMIVRQAEVSDLRRYHFEPTDKGRQALAAGRTAMEHHMEELMGHSLDEDQAETLLHLLRQISAAGDPEEGVLSVRDDRRQE